MNLPLYESVAELKRRQDEAWEEFSRRHPPVESATIEPLKTALDGFAGRQRPTPPEIAEVIAERGHELYEGPAVTKPKREYVPDTCPECGRKRAHSAVDVVNGLCPKWWAIRDWEAMRDCEVYAAKEPAPPAQGAKELARAREAGLQADALEADMRDAESSIFTEGRLSRYRNLVKAVIAGLRTDAAHTEPAPAPPAFDIQTARNAIGGLRVNQLENLGIALCSYFSTDEERPDNDEESETGWGEWVEKRANETLDKIIVAVLKLAPAPPAAGNSSSYWLVERQAGNHCEWLVSVFNGLDTWTTDANQAQKFSEWGAIKQAKEMEQWGILGPLSAIEHIDCDGPTPLDAPAPSAATGAMATPTANTLGSGQHDNPVPLASPPDQSATFHLGARAMFDYFHMRAANNFHADPIKDTVRGMQNELALEWIDDALAHVSPETMAKWRDLNAADARIAELGGLLGELHEECIAQVFSWPTILKQEIEVALAKGKT